MSKTVEQIEDFWNVNLCGHHFVKAPYPSKEFFEQYTQFRYKKTHHLDTYIDWAGAKGKDVLEIGLGIGADATRWGKNAKSYTGVDLTEEAVHATQTHFNLLGLKGNIIKGNAEELPLPDKSFDIVYSHGVLHHTTHIDRTFKHVNRVLRDNGEFIVMLYCKQSFNYWIRIQVWFRIRFLLALLFDKLGIKQKVLWNEHVQNFKNKGWSYFSWSEWPHHCTDGANCEIANIYTRNEVKKMLNDAGFEVVRMKQAHFPAGLPPLVEQKIASLIGFHLITWAKKKK